MNILFGSPKQLLDFQRLSQTFDVLHGFRYIATFHLANVQLQAAYEAITEEIIAYVKAEHAP